MKYQKERREKKEQNFYLNKNCQQFSKFDQSNILISENNKYTVSSIVASKDMSKS